MASTIRPTRNGTMSALLQYVQELHLRGCIGLQGLALSKICVLIHLTRLELGRFFLGKLHELRSSPTEVSRIADFLASLSILSAGIGKYQYALKRPCHFFTTLTEKLPYYYHALGSKVSEVHEVVPIMTEQLAKKAIS